MATASKTTSTNTENRQSDLAELLARLPEQAATSVLQIERAALTVAQDWTERAAAYVPAVPGFPQDVLDAPATIVDRGFEFAEDLVKELTPVAARIVHDQRTFTQDAIKAAQPLIDALARKVEDGEDEATATSRPSKKTKTSDAA